MTALVAVSWPLHYVTIMNTQLCVGLVVTAWMVGFVHSISQLALMLPLPFCGPNVLNNFYCDVPQVLRLTCADTSVLEFLMICICGMLDVIWFLLLLVSYSAIPGDAEVPLRTGKEEGSFHLHRPQCHGVYCLHSKHLPLCLALHLFLH